MVERGPHRRVWQTYSVSTNVSEGSVIQTNYSTVTNSYVELATGLHYWEDNQWKESKAEIELAQGGAVALKGQHKVVFKPNLNAQGAIELTTPDGKHFRSHVIGLGYFDATTGNSSMIAPVKNSIGQLLPPNQIIYPDAFEGVKADVRYTYTIRGFEQDIILRESLPVPAEFGLDPAATRLEVWTEFLDAPKPTKKRHFLTREVNVLKRQQMAAPDLVDEYLDFGQMKMGRGAAFELGAKTQLPDGGSRMPVGKKWERIANRDFLIEALDFAPLEPELAKLPKRTAQWVPQRQANSTALAGSGDSSAPASQLLSAGLAQSRREILANLARKSVNPTLDAALKGAIQIARNEGLPDKGFVLDYTLYGSHSNFTFQGDTTYYVTNVVDLAGTTTIEGGAVVKFATYTGPGSGTLNIDGDLVCQTSPYRPAIFTAKDDNTMGDTITGSSGYPGGWYGEYYLLLGSQNVPAVDIHDLNVRYATYGIGLTGNIGSRIRDVTFLKCAAGVVLNSAVSQMQNLLIQNAFAAMLSSSSTCSVQHVTLDQCQDLIWVSGGVGDVYTLTNSILANVTNLYYSGQNPAPTLNGSHNAFFNTTTFGTNTFSIGANPFQSVGAGYHYLGTNSSLRNVGTTAIDPDLLADLQTRTTYPPQILQNVTVSTNVILSPTIPRNTNTPDLGYHYPAVDYAVNAYTVTNATLSVVGGASIATFGTLGIWLQDGTSFFSVGGPLTPNRFTLYSYVQEQPVIWGGTGTPTLINPYKYGSVPSPATIRFTEFYTCYNSYSLLSQGSWKMSPILIGDSAFYGGRLSLSSEGIGGADYKLSNTLFDRIVADLWYYPPIEAYNNLFKGGSWFFFYTGTNNWTFRDNLFDGVGISQIFNSPVHDHNGYVNGSSQLTPGNTNDVVVTNFTFQTGPLGRFYQPTNSPLIHVGSQPATNAGLYHYTVTTNQVKEGTNTVSIGLHYLALDGAGNPVDTDGDGLPDYVEDRNGNGIVDTGETSYTSSDSDGNGIPDSLEDSDYDGVSNAQELSEGTDPYDANSVLPHRLGYWTFDTTSWLGERGQVPRVATNLQSVASWQTNALLVTPASPTRLINVDCAGGSPSGKSGPAVIGVATNDYWNGYYLPGQSSVVLTNLKWSDTNSSYVGLNVNNAPGAYSYAMGDTMYNTYAYASSSGTITLTLTNLPGGVYDFYLYGHGGAYDQNSQFVLNVGGSNLATNSTGTGTGWNTATWVEGLQYVVFRDVAVAAGTNVVIYVKTAGNYYVPVNGLQIAPHPPTQLSYSEVETNGAPNINLRNGTVRFWYRPQWAGTNVGGAGPGASAELIGAGRREEGTTNEWWSLHLNASGTQLTFEAHVNSVQTNYLSMPITWVSNQWHQIVLTYTPTNSILYLDGQAATNGSGATAFPAGAVRASNGFCVGSDYQGGRLAKGRFEELENFNYPLSAGEVGGNYQQVASRDSDSDGLADYVEDGLGTDKNNPDTDSDGMPDGWEVAYGLNPFVNDASGDLDGDGVTNLDEFTAGTDPTNPASGSPRRLGYWAFDTTAWLGERSQTPRIATNIENVASWRTNALGVHSVAVPPIMNVDFADGAVPSFTGRAATGLSATDYWNHYYLPNQSPVSLTNLQWSDISTSSVGLVVNNGAGHWGFATSSGSTMYDSYAYTWNYGTITITLTNLPGGVYDFYLYGHGDQSTQNSKFILNVGGSNIATNSTGTGVGWNTTNWVEGLQYVVFRDATVSAGTNVVIYVTSAGNYYVPVNGLQIVPHGTGSQLSYKDVESDNSANIAVRNGTVRFWFKPDWASTNLGGAGPGSEAGLIEVGRRVPASTNQWWSLHLDTNGTKLIFEAQVNCVQTNYLTLPISWASNQWHEIVLTYTPTNSILYLDGQSATNGPGVTHYPPDSVKARDGFSIGSDYQGRRSAVGQIEELETYNYPLSAGDIAAHDGDGDGLADSWEMSHFGTIEFGGQDDPDGDGQSNLTEFGASTNPADGMFPIPYLTGFESADGFAPGNLNNQQNWVVTAGQATVQTNSVAQGIQAVMLEGTNGEIKRGVVTKKSVVVIAQRVLLPTGTDFAVYSGDLPALAASLVSYDPQLGILAFNGSGDGTGTWTAAADTINPGQWVTITITEDYSSKTWDLQVNGALKLSGLGFKDNTVDRLRAFHVRNAHATETCVDEVALIPPY